MRKLLTALMLTMIASLSAKTHLYEININDFTELRVDNSINVVYRCNPDSAGIATFDASDDQVSWLLFDNNGRGRLAIQTDIDYPFGEALPTVTVFSSSLRKVVNSGDSTVRAINVPEHAERFEAVLIGNGRLIVHDVVAPRIDASLKSGNGTVVVSGECTDARLHLVGTGTIQADQLRADKVKATIIGTGTIGCDPSEQLTIQGVGSGKVWYRSTPAKIKSRGVGISGEQM